MKNNKTILNLLHEKNVFIFDLDDTLYCEHEYVLSGFKAVAQFISLDNNLDEDSLYNMMEKVWRIHGRGHVFDSVCKTFSITKNVTDLVSIYRSHTPNILLYPDAEKILRYLKRNNRPIGLITDGVTLTQWKKIKALGISSLIDSIVVSDDLGGVQYWKPNEKPFLKAIELLKVESCECIYIGDNPHKDFITAKKLGMTTVRIKREVGDHMKTRLSAEYEADYEIQSLTELIEC